MENGYQFTKDDLLYYALIFAGVGLILGLVPLIIAIRRGKLRLGLLAVIFSTIAGAIAPILSLIVIAIFLWLILRKDPKAAPDTTSDNSDTAQPE